MGWGNTRDVVAFPTPVNCLLTLGRAAPSPKMSVALHCEMVSPENWVEAVRATYSGPIIVGIDLMELAK
jgi:hypothetical protein